MQLLWQDLVALVLVALSAGYLGWQAWRVFTRRRAGACGGGCSRCQAANTQEGKPLVTLTLPARRVETSDAR